MDIHAPKTEQVPPIVGMGRTGMDVESKLFLKLRKVEMILAIRAMVPPPVGTAIRGWQGYPKKWFQNLPSNPNSVLGCRFKSSKQPAIPPV